MNAARRVRPLPNLTGQQVIELQDALLANADRLCAAARLVLDDSNVALARSLAILAMEESAKAIALHERRVDMAYAEEGASFVNADLTALWADHSKKLKLVHRFLVEEQYWFGVGPSNPEENAAYLGTIEAWSTQHNRLKQRGFYVDLTETGNVKTPMQETESSSLEAVIEHVHQIGWQLRLGEHIEASRQVDPPMPKRSGGWNNDEYRHHLRGAGESPFAEIGRPGYEAQTRELMRLSEGDRDLAPDETADPS